MSEKIKKPIYKKWWVWLIAVVIIGGAIGATSEDEQEKSEEVDAAEVGPEESSAADPDKEESDPVETEEEEVDSAALDTYNEYVRDWKFEIILQFDENWEDYWQDSMSDLGDGYATADDVIYDIEELREDHYKPLVTYIDDLEIPNEFSEEQSDLLSDFKEGMIQSVETRIEAIDVAVGMLGSPETIDTDELLAIIDEGDGYMLLALASITQLEMEVGALE